MTEIIQQIPLYSSVLVALLRGPLYESDQNNWRLLQNHQREIQRYFSQMAVRLYMNEVEGFAFLKPLDKEEKEAYQEEKGHDLPTLIGQRKLTYPLTMLIVLLRKELLKFDAQSEQTRLIIEREQIKDLLKPYLPEGNNQAKLIDNIDTSINKLLEMGILRKLQNNLDSFEVNRILKAKVTPVELEDILEKLKSYAKENNIN